MATSTVTSKGQTTIPKAIRDHLHVGPGDRVEFIVEETGRVVVVPLTVDVAALKGILPAPPKPVSLADMQRAIRDRHRRR